LRVSHLIFVIQCLVSCGHESGKLKLEEDSWCVFYCKSGC